MLMKNNGPTVRPAADEALAIPQLATAPKTVVKERPNLNAQLNANIKITTQARHYALAELARRAGVPLDFFRSWRLSWTEDRMVIEIPNGTNKKITFPYASTAVLKGLAEGKISTAGASWMNNTKPRRIETDLVVPFVGGESAARRPLFELAGQDHLECALDLPLATLLTLSRWEETLDVPGDVHGRFVASSSVATRDGFLERPIVDEYGLAFEQALQAIFPSWPRQAREARAKLSLDADHVGIPFSWKSALRHTTHYHTPLDSGRDVLGWMRGIETPDLRALRQAVMLCTECGLDTCVYWKASPPGPRDSGYDPRDPRVRQVINWLLGIGVESGVQPGYATFRSPEKLRREISVLREVLGDGPLGGRQHYLRWRPDTWIHWESCGLAYDTSVGFADRIGFRAGTCIPYRPWLLSLNRRAELLEVPLIAMDRSLMGYMHLNCDQAVAAVKSCLDRCRAVGGVLTIVWHNNTYLDPEYRATYLNLLSLCSGLENYNWRTDNWEQSSSLA
jgi:hypothetical protein